MYERDMYKKSVARSNSQADWMNYKTARNRTNYEQDALRSVNSLGLYKSYKYHITKRKSRIRAQKA